MARMIGLLALLPLLAAAEPNYRTVIDQYCVTCHDEFDKLDLARVPENAEVWEKIIRKVRVGMMPPQDAPHPDAATRQALVSWLETTLDRASAAKPDPGR